MFYFVLVVVPTAVLSLTFLLGAFAHSTAAGLWMSGAYALFIIVGTVAYRFYKKAYEWEQGSIMREMKAIRASQNPKPCYLNEQKGKEAAKRAAQRNREIAALTTRTWRK